jgi:ribosome-binding protein aMBF1 (putative translation factor)
MSGENAATPAAHAAWTSVRGLRGCEPSAEAAYVAARLAVELGAEVRRLREERGWSQAQLAAAASTSTSSVSRVELGAGTPSLPILTRVASALGTELVVALTPRRAATVTGGRSLRM